MLPPPARSSKRKANRRTASRSGMSMTSRLPCSTALTTQSVVCPPTLWGLPPRWSGDPRLLRARPPIPALSLDGPSASTLTMPGSARIFSMLAMYSNANEAPACATTDSSSSQTGCSPSLIVLPGPQRVHERQQPGNERNRDGDVEPVAPRRRADAKRVRADDADEREHDEPVAGGSHIPPPA